MPVTGEDGAAAGQLELIVPSVAATRELGRCLGEHARPGALFALYGPLGAGKTQLSKGILSALGISEDEVVSPTFTLMVEYDGRYAAVHVDLYRLEQPEEILSLGLDDVLQGAVVVIEWAERLGDALPAERLDIRLSYVDDDAQSRRISLEAYGRSHRRLLQAALGKVV